MAIACSHQVAPFCWPTSVSANGRYLLDQSGQPYMIVGDSPQSLIGELSESEANTYFADRHDYGINSAWINLLCDRHSQIPAPTATGKLPGPPRPRIRSAA